VRRGTAHCQLSAYGAGHTDYSAAHALSGGTDPALAADVVRVATLVRCDALKREGDVHFGARETGAALAKYGEALAADAGFVSCLSNRAVCHLTMASEAQALEEEEGGAGARGGGGRCRRGGVMCAQWARREGEAKTSRAPQAYDKAAWPLPPPES
jgi:hypothetical protein